MRPTVGNLALTLNEAADLCSPVDPRLSERLRKFARTVESGTPHKLASLSPALRAIAEAFIDHLLRIEAMPLDLTLLQTALADVQNFVATHQTNNAADQAAVNGLGQQIIDAVSAATPVPPPPPPAENAGTGTAPVAGQ